MRRITLLGLIGGLLPVLAGCSAMGWQARPVPFVGADTELVLRKPLAFPADTTRVYFQGGRMTNARGISVWEQHCALALDHAFETEVSIPAGRWSVVSTQRRTTIGIASRGAVTYENAFLLAAPARPLYALYCETWVMGDGINERNHISADELARVLGDWVELRPVQAPNDGSTH